MPLDDSSSHGAVKARSETRRPSFFWVLAALVLPILNLAVRFRIHHADRMPQAGQRRI